MKCDEHGRVYAHRSGRHLGLRARWPSPRRHSHAGSGGQPQLGRRRLARPLLRLFHVDSSRPHAGARQSGGACDVRDSQAFAGSLAVNQAPDAPRVGVLQFAAAPRPGSSDTPPGARSARWRPCRPTWRGRRWWPDTAPVLHRRTHFHTGRKAVAHQPARLLLQDADERRMLGQFARRAVQGDGELPVQGTRDLGHSSARRSGPAPCRARTPRDASRMRKEGRRVGDEQRRSCDRSAVAGRRRRTNGANAGNAAQVSALRLHDSGSVDTASFPWPRRSSARRRVRRSGRTQDRRCPRRYPGRCRTGPRRASPN